MKHFLSAGQGYGSSAESSGSSEGEGSSSAGTSRRRHQRNRTMASASIINRSFGGFTGGPCYQVDEQLADKCERGLPGVILSQQSNYIETLMNICNLGIQLKSDALRDAARNLLLVLPVGVHIVSYASFYDVQRTCGKRICNECILYLYEYLAAPCFNVLVYTDPQMKNKVIDIFHSHGQLPANVVDRKRELASELLGGHPIAIAISPQVSASFLGVRSVPSSPSQVLYMLEIVSGLVLPARHFIDENSISFQACHATPRHAPAHVTYS